MIGPYSEVQCTIIISISVHPQGILFTVNLSVAEESPRSASGAVPRHTLSPLIQGYHKPLHPHLMQIPLAIIRGL